MDRLRPGEKVITNWPRESKDSFDGRTAEEVVRDIERYGPYVNVRIDNTAIAPEAPGSKYAGQILSDVVAIIGTLKENNTQS